jgi:hypothetical protein
MAEGRRDPSEAMTRRAHLSGVGERERRRWARLSVAAHGREEVRHCGCAGPGPAAPLLGHVLHGRGEGEGRLDRIRGTEFGLAQGLQPYVQAQWDARAGARAGWHCATAAVLVMARALPPLLYLCYRVGLTTVPSDLYLCYRVGHIAFLSRANFTMDHGGAVRFYDRQMYTMYGRNANTCTPP